MYLYLFQVFILNYINQVFVLLLLIVRRIDRIQLVMKTFQECQSQQKFQKLASLLIDYRLSYKLKTKKEKYKISLHKMR